MDCMRRSCPGPLAPAEWGYLCATCGLVVTGDPAAGQLTCQYDDGGRHEHQALQFHTPDGAPIPAPSLDAMIDRARAWMAQSRELGAPPIQGDNMPAAATGAVPCGPAVGRR